MIGKVFVVAASEAYHARLHHLDGLDKIVAMLDFVQY
jgi:hypothetical protein